MSPVNQHDTMPLFGVAGYPLHLHLHPRRQSEIIGILSSPPGAPCAANEGSLENGWFENFCLQNFVVF